MATPWLIAEVIAALLALATVASAQSEIPDLKGKWTGTVGSVRHGEVFEHNPNPAPEAIFGSRSYPITIVRQEGRRFAGTRSSSRATDPMIGTIRSDGSRLVMVDNDGTFTGELLGPDEMEVCRSEVMPRSMIVSCGTYRREH
jgi:hypothetical protein